MLSQVSLCNAAPDTCATARTIDEWLTKVCTTQHNGTQLHQLYSLHAAKLTATRSCVAESSDLSALLVGAACSWAASGNCCNLQQRAANGSNQIVHLKSINTSHNAVLYSDPTELSSVTTELWLPALDDSQGGHALSEADLAALTLLLNQQQPVESLSAHNEPDEGHSEAATALVSKKDPSQCLAVKAILSHRADQAPLVVAGGRGCGVTSVLLAAAASLVTVSDVLVLLVCGSEQRAAAAAAKLHRAGVASMALAHLGWRDVNEASAAGCTCFISNSAEASSFQSTQVIVCSRRAVIDIFYWKSGSGRRSTHVLFDDASWTAAATLLPVLLKVTLNKPKPVVVVAGDPQQTPWPRPTVPSLLGALAGADGGIPLSPHRVSLRHDHTSRAELVRTVSGWYGNCIASGRGRRGSDLLWGSGALIHCVVDEGTPTWEQMVNLEEVRAVCAEISRSDCYSLCSSVALCLNFCFSFSVDVSEAASLTCTLYFFDL